MSALMYHDVVPPGLEDSSGFPGQDAALYKITPERFEAHLALLADAQARGRRLPDLTFDDGGASAMRAADLLERRGFRGWFFVTANYIGAPAFLRPADLRELRRRGHQVGSHSSSHPLRMGHCPGAQLLSEWRDSRARIADVLGADVTAASVPGGDFAPPVAEAAAAAGLTRLYTSEPTPRVRSAHGLSLHGRFAIQRWTTPRTAAAYAAGRGLPCLTQRVVWNVKKAGKRIGGRRYLHVRRMLLGDGREVQWGDTQ
jgi:peptidoglycan/xylan/chitin deacetylase (PgdA/CDA1 family)